jgi:hypothetical protein
MTKTILYFHGFKSSSESSKAQSLKKFILESTKKTKIIIPDLNDNFEDAYNQINILIKSIGTNILFVGSSLGGYYASYFSQIHNSKAVLINPAIPPLKDFDMYLGDNENYSNGNKFHISKEDIKLIRSMHHKKLSHPENIMVLLESGDEVLKYKDTASYFSGAHFDILYGGDHSYTAFKTKFNKIYNFLEIN